MTASGRGQMVIRAPNHLGDLVLALPALTAVPADIVVLSSLAPLLALSAVTGRVIPLTQGAGGFVRAARALRAARYGRGVILPPSFSSALLFAVGGVRERRGTNTDGRGVLLNERVPVERGHRSVRYMALVGEARAVVPRLDLGERLMGEGRKLVGDGPVIGVFPGGNAPSRRWDPTRFAELVRRLVGRGMRVIVFGGPAERELTARVAGGHATDAGGRTDLALLAAAIASCTLLATNDTGPLHLAGAVGTPTVSMWGAGDPAVTGPLGRGHRVIRHPDLPCVPCTKNACPRSGRGTFLPSAHTECLSLITVDAVERLVLCDL